MMLSYGARQREATDRCITLHTFLSTDWLLLDACEYAAAFQEALQAAVTPGSHQGSTGGRKRGGMLLLHAFHFFSHAAVVFFCDVTSSQHDYTMHKYQCILYVDVYSFRLLQLVSKHFRQIHVIEKEVLTYFIYMAKSCRSRFDKGCDGSVP